MNREQLLEALMVERFGTPTSEPAEPVNAYREAAVPFDDDLKIFRRRRDLREALVGFDVPHRGNGRGRGAA